LPYADLETRWAYHRRYQRALRWGLTDGLRRFSVYICPRHPFWRLGPGIAFENSFLVTDKLEIKAMIEDHGDFGKHIFKLKLDFSAVAAEDAEE
jgi:hypothetical protein